jgi:hypothetical protein
MPCPHLKEVVMLYCDAFPVKKMVPLDKIVSADPCLTRNFEHCPLYAEGHAAGSSDTALPLPPLQGKEAQQ